MVQDRAKGATELSRAVQTFEENTALPEVVPRSSPSPANLDCSMLFAPEIEQTTHY